MLGAVTAKSSRALSVIVCAIYDITTQTIRLPCFTLRACFALLVARRLATHAINAVAAGTLPPTGASLTIELLGGTGVVPRVATVT